MLNKPLKILVIGFGIYVTAVQFLILLILALHNPMAYLDVVDLINSEEEPRHVTILYRLQPSIRIESPITNFLSDRTRMEIGLAIGDVCQPLFRKTDVGERTKELQQSILAGNKKEALPWLQCKTTFMCTQGEIVFIFAAGMLGNGDFENGILWLQNASNANYTDATRLLERLTKPYQAGRTEREVADYLINHSTNDFHRRMGKDILDKTNKRYPIFSPVTIQSE